MNLRKDHYWFEVGPLLASDSPNSRSAPDCVYAVSGSSVGRSLVCGRPQHCERAPWLSRSGRPAGGLRLAQVRSNRPKLSASPIKVWVCKLFPVVDMYNRSFSLKVLLLERAANVEKIQHCTVDHLARGSMKNAANCASSCELQDT